MATKEQNHDYQKLINDAQTVIDVYYNNLVGFRTQCPTTRKLTLREIRSSEEQIIRQVAQQIIYKNAHREKYGTPTLNHKNIPRFKLWLEIVGLCHGCVQSISLKFKTVESLLEKQPVKLKNYLSNCVEVEEEYRRLSTALNNLKLCIDLQLKQNESLDVPLYWDSFDNQENDAKVDDFNEEKSFANKLQKSNLSASSTTVNGDCVFDDAKHNIQFDDRSPSTGNCSLQSTPVRSPVPTLAYNSPSSNRSTQSKSKIEKDDRIIIRHDIAHHFILRSILSVNNSNCDFCRKPIRWTDRRVQCGHCGYKCHKTCEKRVPSTCGLPEGLAREYIQKLVDYKLNRDPLQKYESRSEDSFPESDKYNRNGTTLNTNTINKNNITAPSSPNLFINNKPIPATASPVLNNQQLFNFSNDAIKNQQNEVKFSVKNGTEIKVAREENKVDSREDDQEFCLEDSLSSQSWGSDASNKMPRQNSVSMKEWEIPWDDIQLGDKVSNGLFGTVYRGYWHGDVAVKVLDTDHLGDEKMLATFKSEISTFRKTRHDNLVLFMGACMKLPHLAIVTRFLNGVTLYKYVRRQDNEKISMNRVTILAQQITQGMSYLHAKGIVHKDLRSKNIFVEKERIIITDFGLFNVSKLRCKPKNPLTSSERLRIPSNWLCYLAPEIVQNLRVRMKSENEQVLFTPASDMYAFGTVWYELLCGEWPYYGQHTESVLWQVGKGMKPSLANLEASLDVRAILMQCWSYTPSKRPDFTSMGKKLERLPRKKLARSPSHPVQTNFSRSAESMF